ncbi:unnamed protein product [Gongylonema pulchrum]|uniref:Cyclic nucleotide-binding domain-containing protein n=1 Tax=Gongylonema pulchrum TaxID=637853 RepID=A0A183EI84_9BILA|nr:unnamed protein product [Gongylonema pulchrum]
MHAAWVRWWSRHEKRALIVFRNFACERVLREVCRVQNDAATAAAAPVCWMVAVLIVLSWISARKRSSAPSRSSPRPGATSFVLRFSPSEKGVFCRQGQIATCWYILLSGCVFMDKQIYLPCGCFGKRNGLDYRRKNDCVVLQPSEMIVIDYPDVKHITVNQEHICSLANAGRLRNSLYGAANPAPPAAVTVSLRPNAASAASTSSVLPQRFHRTAKQHPASSACATDSRCERKHRSFCRERNDFLPSTAAFSCPSTYKSQVYLNGLSADADAAYVKVKHRTRKSNSLSGTNGAAERYARLSSTTSSSTNEDDLRGSFPSFSFE